MPTNHENYPQNQENINPTLEQSEEHDSIAQHNIDIGAKILALGNFETRHKPIVESSFNKAKKHGEKLSGKNNERRNYAYLSRLEKLIDKHGNDAEKRLWQSSIRNDLLVEENNITEATWKAKQQEYRDNGHGYPELTNWFKREHTKEWRKLQKESLEKWANYLGDEHSPYPLWFKVYAWDGMTKMGVYNKTKREYEKRNETTVAPYPEPDAEILGRVFEIINRYYGNNEREFYTEDGKRNINLEKAAQSSSFAKIYNAIQQDISPLIEPPERAEDVHGEWIEYKPGDEEYIAIAAKGTGWCVASSAVGKHYLEHGTYGTNNEDNSEERTEELKSKFILFHLEDPATNKLSKNAVASIRLDPDGQVAEISGLRDGQSLDDSLVQIVEEKVKTLPGGKEFLPKFADKNKLIRLDRRMKNGEDLTKEELEFIYEIHRPIKTLDTYNSRDPRINELRKKYNIEYALNAGIDSSDIIKSIDGDTLCRNLDTLTTHGVNTDELLSRLGTFYIAEYLDTLTTHGVNRDELLSRLGPYYIADNLDNLITHGANIDELVSRLEPHQIVGKLDTIIIRGVNIDKLVSRLGPYDIAQNLDTLITHGAHINIDRLVSQLNRDILSAHSSVYDIEELISQLTPLTKKRHSLKIINSWRSRLEV